MDNQKNPPRRGLSGFQIKTIALLLMVVDHIGQFFQPLGTPVLLRWLGRLSAPLFCYMLAEGYSHTRNVKKYLAKLYAGFLVMGLGNFALVRLLPRSDGFLIENNIFGLFFLAVLYMLIYDRLLEGLKAQNAKQVFLSLGGAVLPFLLEIPLNMAPEGAAKGALYIIVPGPFSVEGGVVFLFFSLMLYVLRKRRAALCAFVILFSALMFPFGGGVDAALFWSFQWMMGLSLPLMLAYDGRRGYKRQGFFYLFYPVHIWLVYLVSRFYI